MGARLRTFFGGTGLVGGLVAAACSASPGDVGSSLDGGETGGDSSIAPTPGQDGGDGAETSADAAPTPAQTYLRIGHVSPDSPPFDVCVAPHGTNVFQGPLVGQFAAGLVAANGDAGRDGGGVGDGGGAGDAETAEDGGVVGVAYSQISAYIPLAPGQYDVRIVAAGATSCDPAVASVRPFDDGDGGDGGGSVDAGAADGGVDASLSDSGALDASVDGASEAGLVGAADAGADASGGGPIWTSLPSLAASAYATLLVAGDLVPVGADAPLTVTILPDDAVLAGGAAELRAINAMPSYAALDFGLRSTAEWMPLLVDVTFAAASSQVSPGNGTVDANGYLPIGPLSAQGISARRAGSDAGVDTAGASSVAIVEGSIATVLAIGGKTGDSANPPTLLLCTDNQPVGGVLSDCSVAQ